MKIAIPVNGDQLNPHFGHCETFAFYDINQEAKSITSTDRVTPPPHEPGVLPGWLAEQGVNLVITGGMGQRAIQLCQDNKIEVILGAKAVAPAEIVQQFLSGGLSSGSNACDH